MHVLAAIHENKKVEMASSFSTAHENKTIEMGCARNSTPKQKKTIPFVYNDSWKQNNWNGLCKKFHT